MKWCKLISNECSPWKSEDLLFCSLGLNLPVPAGLPGSHNMDNFFFFFHRTPWVDSEHLLKTPKVVQELIKDVTRPSLLGMYWVETAIWEMVRSLWKWSLGKKKKNKTNLSYFQCRVVVIKHVSIQRRLETRLKF